MGKIIFWIVVFFVALLALRLFNVAKSRQRAGERQRREARRELPPAEPTVRCERCGVFLPREEATRTSTGYRCGDATCSPRR
jgi:hypothetical protein